MKNRLSDFLMFNPKYNVEDQTLEHQFTFLNNVIIFAAVVALGMGLIRWQTSKLLGFIDFGFSIVSILLLYYLNNHKKQFKLISNIAFILSFILFYSIYLLAPYNTTRVILFFLLSSAIFFLKGRVTGLYWIILILCSIVLADFIPYVNTQYSAFDILTTCTYLIAYYFIFDSYAASREKQQTILEQNNLALEKKIHEQSKELHRTRKALEVEKKALKYQSTIDTLTGLNNRHKLKDIFEFEKQQVLRYQTNMCIILINIDFFRSVNDTFGHTVGDAVLIEIASILNKVVRRSDVLIRWSGDEFVIFATKTNIDQAMLLTEKLDEKIKNYHFKSMPGKISVSFGITSFYKDDTLEHMIQRADNFIHTAKINGDDKKKSNNNNAT